MKGHREPYAPILTFCQYSGCIISGDVVDKGESSLFIWNIYKDLTVKYDINPPWIITPVKVMTCH